jgi:hypothetical protein
MVSEVAKDLGSALTSFVAVTGALPLPVFLT